MTTCIIVLGVPRSGTSTVAGTLHRLGVDMGTGFLQQPDHNNPRGYYEDIRWQFIHKRMVGDRYNFFEAKPIGPRLKSRAVRLIAECAKYDLWGFKSPRSCWTMHQLLPLFDGVAVRYVAVHRDFDASVASLKRHSERSYNGYLKMTGEKAEEIIRRWKNAQLRRLEEFTGETYHVSYEELLSDTAAQVERLAAWVGVPVVQDAIDWIAPGLNHAGTHAAEASNAESNDNHTDAGSGTRGGSGKKRACNCGN